MELESQEKRILLDLGMPLDAEDGEIPMPEVPGINGGEPSLLGVVISHLHGDHCGLVPYAAPSLPVAMGPAAARILRQAEFFTGRPPLPEPTWPLLDRKPFDIGPFKITPYLMEHSAFDAFALLVEADGRRLFYTGDFRAHGNDGGPFERLLADPPQGVHALMMEGTQIGDGRSVDGPSEDDLRRALARRFKEWPGLVLAAWSSQNLDRLRTVYEAAREAGRALVVDLYTGTLAAAAGDPRVPGLGAPNFFVCPREGERRAVVRAREFERVDSIHHRRVKREVLRHRGREFVALFRPSMTDELERVGALPGALAVWSMWRGYLEGSSEKRMSSVLERHGVPLEVHHVSGHAYVPDLQGLVGALRPERLIPIHTQEPRRYSALFPRVEVKRDGEWWEV